MKKVSLFIPVYNEEKIIEKSAIEVNNFIKSICEEYEIVIVDDNSSDNTPKIARKIANESRNIKYIRYNLGPSRRENLASSFKLAAGDIIIFMDADLSTDLKYTRGLIKNIEEGYDIVTGSRHIKGAVSKRKFSRKFISCLLKYFIKLYFNSKINDHECGFKAFKRGVIFQLVDEMGYDDKFKRKMMWDTEMFIRAQRIGYRIKEIPVEWKAGEKSALRFWRELSMIPYIIKLKFRLR